MMATKCYSASRTVWLSVVTHVAVAVLTYVVAWSQTDADFDVRTFVGVVAGALLATVIPVVGGRRRGGLPLGRGGRVRAGRPRLSLLGVVVVSGALCASCGASLSRTAIVGPLAAGAMAGLQCPGVDVQVRSDFSRPEDLVTLEDALQVLAEIGRDGQAERSRDVVRVLMRCPPPGPWLEVYLEFGVVAGRGVPAPDG